MKFEDPHDRSVAAGEYVLGSLAADERAMVEAALPNDAALQAEVYLWQDRLLTLALRVEPLEPHADTWAGIARGLAAPHAPADAANAPPRIAQVAQVAAMDQPAANDALWRKLRVWQTVSGVAIAACLVLATLLVTRQSAMVAPEQYLTLLQAPDKSTGWLVEVTAGRRLRLLPIGPPDAVPSGKALQFWTKLDGAQGPTSLGLVKPGQVIEVTLDRLPGVAERQLFELTLEPETGSPIGRPTGPILYVGRSLRL